jgi:stage IV sporulation protein FA
MKVEGSKYRTSIWFYVWSILIILGCCWTFLQWNHPLAERARNNLEVMAQSPINWDFMTDWYTKYIQATPAVAPALDSQTKHETQSVNANSIVWKAPVRGEIWMPYTAERQGVFIQTLDHSAIEAVADGRVIFVGEMTGLGNTVIVQHANGYQSWYGFLGQVQVQKNDWVPSKTKIANKPYLNDAQQGYFFFALKADEDFLNPLEVIKFD